MPQTIPIKQLVENQQEFYPLTSANGVFFDDTSLLSNKTFVNSATYNSTSKKIEFYEGATKKFEVDTTNFSGSAELMTEITWSSLYTKMANDELTPGMQYYITDYYVIVTADNEYTINPFARISGEGIVEILGYNSSGITFGIIYYTNGGFRPIDMSFNNVNGTILHVESKSNVGLVIPASKTVAGIFVGHGNSFVTFDFTNAPNHCTLIVDPYVYTGNINKTVSIVDDYTIIRKQDVHIMTDVGDFTLS